MNRGSVYSTLNRYDDAGALFREGLRIRKQHLRDDDPLLANSYMQVGNYYTSQGDIGNAVSYHRQGILIRERSPQVSPNMMVISYFNLCRTLLLGKQEREASEMLEKAQEWEKLLPPGREATIYRCQ